MKEISEDEAREALMPIAKTLQNGGFSNRQINAILMAIMQMIDLCGQRKDDDERD